MANKNMRTVKIYGMSGYKYQATPAIMLKGKWLEELGFEIGDYITKRMERGVTALKAIGWYTQRDRLVLMVMLGCVGAANAEVIPPLGPGQQIGYPAVVLCEKITLREKPSSSSEAVQSLDFGDLPIVIGAALLGLISIALPILIIVGLATSIVRI